MLAFSTLLAAATLQKHRCALKANKPYGWRLAILLSILQISPVVELLDKLGDRACWNSSEEDRHDPFATRLADKKGRQYSENLMRGLRKLSIASVFSSIPSTVCHLRILLFLVADTYRENPVIREFVQHFTIMPTIIASIVGLISVSIAWGDLVLYIWVDDMFVRSHKVVVQLHYMVEIMARLPTIAAFIAVATESTKGHFSVTWVIVGDILVSVLLLVLPTLIAGGKRRLSYRHVGSQFVTAFCVSCILFFCNVAFFDSREAFKILNSGYYLAKYAEVIIMLRITRQWWIDDTSYADDSLDEKAEAVFSLVSEIVFFVHALNFAMVWIVVPWMRHKMEEQAMSRLSRLEGSSSHSSGARFSTVASMGGGRGGGGRPGLLKMTSTTFTTKYLNDVQALELESVAAPQDADARWRVLSGAGLRAGSDKNWSFISCLGDILDALCLLSQTQSLRNCADVSRTCISGVLWSLLLPWEGLYDDGTGGKVRIVLLDPRRSTLLVQRLRTDASTGSGRPFRSSQSGHDTDDLSCNVEKEFVAVIIQGTVIEMVLEEEGHMLGTYDGRCISFAGGRLSKWTRVSEDDSFAHKIGGTERAQILRLVLPQLVLAIRWEPTFIGLSHTGMRAASDSAAVAIDASQRPLLSFVVRYCLVARDAELLSEVYWSLWCLSLDTKDHSRGVYEKARWVLVSALRGEIEFWEGSRGIRLSCQDNGEEQFCLQTLQLLRKQSVVWRQSAVLARLAVKAEGDNSEKNRVVRKQMQQWRTGADHVEQQPEDHYLDDVEGDGDEHDESCGFFDGLSMPIDPGVIFRGLDSCEVLQSNACPLLLTCKVEVQVQPERAVVESASPTDLFPNRDSTMAANLDQSAFAGETSTENGQGSPRESTSSDISAVSASSRADPDAEAGARPFLASAAADPRSSQLVAAAVAAAVMRKEASTSSKATPSSSSRATPLLSGATPPAGHNTALRKVVVQGADDDDETRSTQTQPRKYLVKVGDDLRQDQLVLQMFGLMERVWRERLPTEEHEMLQLAPYRVLAMTPDAGYIQFVPGAISMSKVLQQGDLASWLDARKPSSMTLEDVLQNLCGSVAAYCVATYVLGIGDRHLDNLQITTSGHFFHIDFGFIFGSDPKPFAPQLRLPSPIATALLTMQAPGPRPGQAGVSKSALGKDNENMLDRCLLLAGRAYIALRRSMPLWMPLLRVIGEAGGAGCQMPRSDAAMLFVQDRLRSDLGDHEEEAAVADFLLVLCENVEALYPMLTDKVHQLGLFWK